MVLDYYRIFICFVLQRKTIFIPFKCLVPFPEVSTCALAKVLFLCKHLLPCPFFLESVYTQQLQERSRTYIKSKDKGILVLILKFISSSLGHVQMHILALVQVYQSELESDSHKRIPDCSEFSFCDPFCICLSPILPVFSFLLTPHECFFPFPLQITCEIYKQSPRPL